MPFLFIKITLNSLCGYSLVSQNSILYSHIYFCITYSHSNKNKQNKATVALDGSLT